jgi:hypothetical protein
MTEHLKTRLKDAADRGTGLFALLDSAQAEGAFRQLDEWGLPYDSLFEDTNEKNLTEIAPLQVPLSIVPEERIDEVLIWLEGLAKSAPCVSWFESNVYRSAVAAHLRRFHLVDLTQKQRMMMRWYDTRILTAWTRCLTAPQRELFFAGSSRWGYMDRYGHTQSLESPEAPSPIPQRVPTPYLGQPIQLDDQQFAVLMSSADADILVTQLREILPDETRQLEQKPLLTFVEQVVQACRAAGVEDLDRQLSVVILAAYTSGHALQTSVFKQWIDVAPADSQAFSESMQKLPEAVWSAGPPLWAQADRSFTLPDDWMPWLTDDRRSS